MSKVEQTKGIEENGNKMSLIITNSQKDILSKQQQTFNKLVKRIEKLRLELQQLNNVLDEKIDFYAKQIHPLEQELIVFTEEYIVQLYHFFISPKLLSKKQKESLGEMIALQLDRILDENNGDMNEALKTIFETVNGKTIEQAKKDDFETMKDKMGDIFEQYGVDVNLNDLHSDMTAEELMKKTMEFEEQVKQNSTENNNRQKSKKKSKKQLEKENLEKQVEEAKTKNIGKIYRQLAKMFHPDLEQDETLKLDKEELMKQLTIAYEKNDLHTLLRLELAWIQKEENNPDKLTDEKLAIYNQVLKEQVMEMEDEITDTLHHPKYERLHGFTFFPEDLKTLNMRGVEKDLRTSKRKILELIEQLKGDEKQAILLVKEIVNAYNFENKYKPRSSDLFR